MNVIFNLLDGGLSESTGTSGSSIADSVSSSGSSVTASSSQGTDLFQSLFWWIIVVVLIVGFFVFNYFTRKKQQKAIEEKMSSIKSGDKIKTIGLICGTVVSVDDVQNTVVIATGDEDHQSFLTIDKSAIYQIFPAGSGVNGVTQVNDETENNAVNGESENSDAEIDELAENEKDDENKENE